MRQARGRLVGILLRKSGLTGLALLTLVQAQHQVIGRVCECDQLQMRLQRQQRVAVECGNLIDRERVVFGQIECFHKGPLDARHIHSQRMASGAVLRVGREPLWQFAAQIAQRERAAGIGREIRNGERVEGTAADHCAQARKILRQRAQHAKPVLAVVDFQPFKGRKLAVGRDERAGHVAHGAAVWCGHAHLFVRGQRLHHRGGHSALQFGQIHRTASTA